VTESAILSQVARAFGIDDWPIAAIKCYLGHSLGSASGDQFAATLGSWQNGILPGIATIDAIADDVHQEGLAFQLEHRQLDLSEQHYAIVNSKGFGGNNASATMLSPLQTARMLQKRYSKSEWASWQAANEAVRQQQQDYDEGVTAGTIDPVYKFDHGVLGDDDVEMTAHSLSIDGRDVALDWTSPYDDMLPDQG
ncbi:MAG: beta-ketoacyl synthase, partial [Pseudomonadota bacterium]